MALHGLRDLPRRLLAQGADIAVYVLPGHPLKGVAGRLGQVPLNPVQFANQFVAQQPFGRVAGGGGKVFAQPGKVRFGCCTTACMVLKSLMAA